MHRDTQKTHPPCLEQPCKGLLASIDIVLQVLDLGSQVGCLALVLAHLSGQVDLQCAITVDTDL